MPFDTQEAPEAWKLKVEDFDVFSAYFEYVKITEAPINVYRWCLLSSIATLLARNCYFVHGHSRIFPNLYITIVGEPAARKSSAIKGIKRLMRRAGYETFAADKTSKEQFLVDLEGFVDPEQPENKWRIKEVNPQYDAVTASNLWGGDLNGSDPREVFIAADEFSEFTGNGNLEFYTTLGNLWDFDDEEKPFVQRLKTTRSVSIYQPTVNILSGTTSDLFSKIFPPEAIGSGFLSRLLLVYAERSGRRIAFPPPPDALLEAKLITYFRVIREQIRGEIDIDPDAKQLMDELYNDWHEVDDVRFQKYNGRSFTQLIKLSMIISIARFRHTITAASVIEANTILLSTEYNMPKAMGEFGKSKNSDVASKVLQKLEDSLIPMSALELQAYIRRDINKASDLMDILQSLLVGRKIQIVKLNGKSGYLPLREVRKKPKFVDWNYLTQEERELAGVLGV